MRSGELRSLVAEGGQMEVAFPAHAWPFAPVDSTSPTLLQTPFIVASTAINLSFIYIQSVAYLSCEEVRYLGLRYCPLCALPTSVAVTIVPLRHPSVCKAGLFAPILSSHYVQRESTLYVNRSCYVNCWDSITNSANFGERFCLSPSFDTYSAPRISYFFVSCYHYLSTSPLPSLSPCFSLEICRAVPVRHQHDWHFWS
jgi:hypothetical protein